MEIDTIVLFIIAVVGIVFLIRIVKSVIKILFIGTIIVLVLFAGFTYFFVKDVSSFTKGITHDKNIFLLLEGEDVVTGITITGLNITTASSINTNKVNKKYKDKEYDDILDGSYKLFIINESAYEVDVELEPVEKIIDEDIEVNSALNAKALAFTQLTIHQLNEDPLFLLKQYRKGSVIIYPETILFKILKFGSK